MIQVEQVPAYRWRCPSCRRVGPLQVIAGAAQEAADAHRCDVASLEQLVDQEAGGGR